MTVKIDTINISDNKVTKKQYKFEPIEEINLGLLHQVVKGSRTNFRNNTSSVKTPSTCSTPLWPFCISIIVCVASKLGLNIFVDCPLPQPTSKSNSNLLSFGVVHVIS